MAARKDIPKFGLLSGVKVVHNCVSIAGPFAAELYAENGADVIWVENPHAPAMNRATTGSSWQQDMRNQRTIAVDVTSPEGKEVFISLLSDADVYISAAKGGQLTNWGLTDEFLWEQNPKLIIVHITGFGETGLPEYVKRPSYDPIAQAFGGFMDMNGFIDKPSMPTNPLTADFFTAFFAFGMSLAALYKRVETGKGESIDLAQYEALIRCQSRYPMDYLNLGMKFIKEGSHSAHVAGYGTYLCKDGKEIYILFLGAGVLKRGMELIGLKAPEGASLLMLNSPEGQELEKTLTAYCLEHTAEELEKIFVNAGVTASRIMGYEDMVKDPQYKAREVFVQWPAVNGEMVTGVGTFPKLANHPQQIWRGAPNIGMDNEDILKEIGLTDEQIQALYDKKILGKRDYIAHL